MRLPGNRTLLVLAAVLIGAWLLVRHSGSGMNSASLPWNLGQAGSIFQGTLGGGGQ